MTRLVPGTTRLGGRASRRSGRNRCLASGACAAVVLGCGLGAATASAWEVLPALETPRQEVAAAWVGDALFVVGGFDTRGQTLGTVERWSPGDPAWRPAAPLLVPVNHPAAAVVAGELVVVGGYAGPFLANATDTVQIYDPQADAWRIAAPLPTPRGALAAVALSDGLIALGGARDGVSVADVARYDASLDAWSELPAMPTPRDHLGAALLDGRLHAVGGRTGGHGAIADDFTLAVHDVLDLERGSWRAAADMPTGRSGHAVALLDGCLYALGGEGQRQRADGMFDEVERYVAARDAWERLEPMPVPRHGMGAVPVGGRLLVPGGGTVAGLGATGHVDAWTPPPCP
jgi:N-acetylneuraminic acid mutarotase